MKKLKVPVILLLAVAVTFAFMAVVEEAALAEDEEYEIAVIVKATDSGFWQDVFTGAEAADEEMDNVSIDYLGPPSEADIAQQVAILEDVVIGRPDAIVLASTSSDATVPQVDMAYEQEIPVVLIDNMVHTDNYATFLATDNVYGGELAAETMVEIGEEEYGIDYDEGGVLGHIAAMAGVEVLSDRDEGFIGGFEELAPEVEILEPRYVDNRIPDALSATEDIILSYGDDIVGFWANNNHTGIGTARALEEAGTYEDYPAIAFDADDDQVEALEDGYLDALMVQDPFAMGYEGVHAALDALAGEELEDYVDTGVTVVTQENMDDEEIQLLLNPEDRKEYVLEQQ